MSAVVLALRCPQCGGEFGGTAQDVVFWCATCRAPFEVTGSTFQARKGALAQAMIASGGDPIHLPVWAFRVRTTLTWQDAAKAERARELPPIAWVYVTAFQVHNPSYFGDAGKLLTARQPDFRPADTGLPLGCARGMDDATRFVDAHLLGLIDRHVDVTGLTLRTAITETVLWGIPYFDEGAVVRDGIFGETIPAAVVEALPDIRKSRTDVR